MKTVIVIMCTVLVISACKSTPKAGIDVYKSMHELVLNSDTSGVEKIISDTDPSVVRQAINRPDDRGRTLLHIAVGNAKIGLTEILLKSGADPDGKDKNGQTPLHIAVLNQAGSIVALLVENNASKTIVDKDKKTPEDYAWELNNLSILNILNAEEKAAALPKQGTLAPEVKNGTAAAGPAQTSPGAAAPIIPPPSQVQKTFIAPSAGAFTVSFGTSNLDIVDAVKKGEYNKVERLLANKQNPNTLDSQDNSILLYAVNSENASLAQLLIEKGANPGLANRQKQTPLLCAVSKNSYQLVETIVGAGAPVNHADANGVTPLWLAVQNGNGAIVQYLLARGAHVNDRDRSGNVALHIAVANADVSCTRALVQNGADVYIANQSGITPLDLLKQSQRPELRQLAANY